MIDPCRVRDQGAFLAIPYSMRDTAVDPDNTRWVRKDGCGAAHLLGRGGAYLQRTIEGTKAMLTTIQVCTENALLCDLLVDYLCSEGELDVACVETISSDAQPDVLLLDGTGAPARLAEIDTLRAAHPDLKVVVFGIPDDPVTVLAFARAGATAILPLDSSVAQVIAAIRDVSAARTYCSAQLGRTLLAGIAQAGDRDTRHHLHDLTPREKEIANCLQQGLSNKEIARSLSIEVTTTKNHVHNLLQKMGVTSRGKAVAALKDFQTVDT